MGSQDGHPWVRGMEGAQLVRAVVGFPIVEEQAHNRMRCAALSDGFEVQMASAANSTGPWLDV